MNRKLENHIVDVTIYRPVLAHKWFLNYWFKNPSLVGNRADRVVPTPPPPPHLQTKKIIQLRKSNNARVSGVIPFSPNQRVMQFWPFSLWLARVILCVNFDWPKQLLSRTNLLPLTKQYFWIEGSVLNASFVRRITHEQRMVKASGQGDQYPFGWRVFSAWDLLITERETAENKLASLTTAIKVWLSL